MADSSASEDSPNPVITGESVSTLSWERLVKRNESLVQENKVLKVEVETYKLRVKALVEENRGLRQASVHIQAKAEQEEEFISNTLLKKIQALKKEKENLALNYEQEEECLTNDLSRKLNQLRQEKVQLEHTLEQEQECLVNKLMRRIEKLENETTAKQTNLETLRREKIELENTLEQEQEALVNKLWKRMDRLETEKRSLQVKLDQPVSEPPSPRSSMNDAINNGDTADNLTNSIHALREECARLKRQLTVGKEEHERKMAEYAKEEREVREENLRLQRRLQLEVERREALCRHLSESESSLEMEEERVYNGMTCSMGQSSTQVQSVPSANVGPYSLPLTHRSRTLSSPISGAAFSAGTNSMVLPPGPPTSSRPLSPGTVDRSRDPLFSPPSMGRPHHHHGGGGVLSPSPPPNSLLMTSGGTRRSHVPERFVKPPIPAPSPNVAAASPASVLTSEETKPPSSPMDVSDSSTK